MVVAEREFPLPLESKFKGDASMNIYKHKHHIIPRHAGGTDEKSNLIELTVEEHAEAHRLLYEQHCRWQDRIAWQTLSGQISSYEAAHQARREANLGNTHFKGKTHTKEVRKRISEFQKKAKIGNKNRLGTSTSEEGKKNISIGLIGNYNNKGGYTLSDEFKEACKERMTGDNNPAKRDDVREKLRRAALKREAKKREERLHTAE